MKERRRKWIKGLILALAAAAVLVPAASGHIYEGGSTGYVSVDESTSTDAGGYSAQALQALTQRWTKRAESYYRHSYTPQALEALTQRWTKLAESYQRPRPDDRAGIRGSGGEASDVVDRQLAIIEAKANSGGIVRADDRAGIRGPGPVEAPPVVSADGGGFDWTDAGIGASSALVAAALLAAAAVARRRAGLAV